MQKILTSFACLLLCFQLFAQRERNYIYILDCSNSMLVNRSGEKTLWDATLDYLHSDIGRQTESSMINIVPFQGDIYPTTQSVQGDIDWDKFYDKVKDYPQKPIGTNICKAWDTAVTMQDPNKDNYIILLTDGEDNFQGVDAVCARIREWCEKVKNCYGYYVMLSKEAMNPKIVEEVERCRSMFVVEGKEGLKPFGSLEKSDFTYNTREPKNIEVPVSTAGTFEAKVSNDDPNFDLELVDNVIKDGKGVIRITPKPDADLSLLEEVSKILASIEGIDLNVLNPDLSITVNNVPEKLLTLPSEEKNAGEAEWYDSFLWSKAAKADTLVVDLEPDFNKEAKAAGSSVRMVVRSLDKDGNRKPLEKTVTVLWNGEAASNGEFEIDTNHEAQLGLVFAPEASEGKHYFEISAVAGGARHLDRINDDLPAEYVTTVRAEYDIDANPLKVFFIWMGIIIIAALLLWFCIIKYLLFPTIKVKRMQIECAPILKNPIVSGCRKVVFTSKRQQQNIFSRIFTGEIKYVKDDIFDSEWYITPGTKKDRVRAGGVSGYQMNPPGSNLTKHETVTMKSNATGRILKVTPC